MIINDEAGQNAVMNLYNLGIVNGMRMEALNLKQCYKSGIFEIYNYGFGSRRI